MKGQFMLISSILIGFIVISTASTISEVQRQNFESESTSKTLEMIKDEAGKIDHSDRQEIENFRKMVSSLSEYRTQVRHWSAQNCFNVTLSSPDGSFSLNCI
jgi:hypothetical protein